MADAADAAGETYSKEMVEKLKAELAEKSEEAAKLRAFKNGHDEKSRAVIAKMQPDIQAFVGSLIENNADQAADMAPIGEWAKTCHESASLETAMPLARVLSCASNAFKRSREEASVLSGKANTLGSTLKELEEIKADRDAKAARIAELESLCTERQTAAEKLQDELAKAGVLKDRFDFSKLSSREAKAEPEPAAGSSSLQAVTSNASRKAPMKAVEDELMSFVSRTSSGTAAGRVNQSATGHAFLGATAGGMEAEIASAVRGC